MKRRFFLTRLGLLGSVFAAAATVQAHTPYRFWNVFRKRNMQIMTSLEDVPGDDTGEAWVTVLRDQFAQNQPSEIGGAVSYACTANGVGR
jgi:hypothetical protein